MTPSLPHRMYLLCYDADKGKLESSSVLVRGVLMRAAAAGDLTVRGLLRDRAGKAERTDATAHPGDPFLAEVLDRVPVDRPRRWFDVVDHRWHKAESAVRDQLAGTGALTVDRRRALGLFPVSRVTLADPGPARALQQQIRAVVLGDRDPATVPFEDAMLALLCIDGDVCTVSGRRERMRHRAATRAVTGRIDAELPRFRKDLGWSIAARRTPGSS